MRGFEGDVRELQLIGFFNLAPRNPRMKRRRSFKNGNPYNIKQCVTNCPQTALNGEPNSMQFHLFPGFLIFLGSYLPLAIILAVQDIPVKWWALPLCTVTTFKGGECQFMPFENPILSLTFLVVSAVAILLAKSSLQKIKYPFLIEVKRLKATPNEIINYSFPYVVSFMGIGYGDPQKLIGFGVFLIWMFAITLKSGQILMNPLLLIFGWRLYEATIVINNVEKDVRVLKRGRLEIGLQMGQTVQDFYILRDK